MPTSWWIDNAFLNLTPTAQRLLLVLWTSPETATCGIATAGIAQAADRLRLPTEAVAAALEELVAGAFVTVDTEAPLIWLHSFVELQLGGLPASNPKWLSATAGALAQLPDTAMVRRYRMAYGIPHRYPIDSPSIPHAIAPPLPVPASPSQTPGAET